MKSRRGRATVFGVNNVRSAATVPSGMGRSDRQAESQETCLYDNCQASSRDGTNRAAEMVHEPVTHPTKTDGFFVALITECPGSVNRKRSDVLSDGFRFREDGEIPSRSRHCMRTPLRTDGSVATVEHEVVHHPMDGPFDGKANRAGSRVLP